ncbi:MAG: hypothetical protein CM1200mP41_38360 [Gammaproteobacteria bacterium]|nr:MAG: hypothetical protein CM1200mP41_38360 [Gammaproteobacteria bacterium]
MKVTVINVVAFKVAWLLTVFAPPPGPWFDGAVGCHLLGRLLPLLATGLKHNLLFIALAFSVGGFLSI